MSKIIKQIGQIDPKLNKINLERLGKDHAAQILANDKYDVLKVYIEFKRYEVYLKTLIDELREDTFTKARAEGNLDFEYSNARVSLGVRRKFDYSMDEEWTDLNDEIEKLKALKKNRESLMKDIKGDFKEILNEDTGEIEKIFAPIAEYIDTFRVKL